LAFATINIPISDWWGGSSKMKEQKVHIKIAQNKIDETEELLELEMEKNYKNLNEAYERIFVAQKSITQAEEHHRVIRDNYSAGLVNTSDLLEAQAMLQQTKDAETEALVNYKIRLAHYLKSIGK
jgi:outer membrane protein TolC